jgi:hypothetical protein
VLHGLPQAPQLALSFPWMFTHALLQIELPETLHVFPQDVPLHVAEPPLGAWHCAQLAPHALMSLSTQVLPQRCVPPVH